jgi:hypothetical protein
LKERVIMGNNLRRILTSICLLSLLSACAANLAELAVMTPVQVENAIQQGASGLPYLVYSNTNLQSINETCKVIPTPVTVEDTYLSAYGKKLADVLPEGETGHAFHNMREASLYFQKILKDKGESRPEDYIFTSINTALKKGYILFAIVKRSERSISVVDKYDKNLHKKLGPQDLEYYQPYQSEINGNILDTVVDWAGYPNDCISKQSSQAVLMTITANEILNHEIKEGYWDAEERWVKGDFKKVMKEQDKKTCIACGFSEGFFQE